MSEETTPTPPATASADPNASVAIPVTDDATGTGTTVPTKSDNTDADNAVSDDDATSDLEGLTAYIASLKSERDDLKGQVATLTSSHSDASTRADALQKKLDKIMAVINETLGTDDTSTDTSTNAGTGTDVSTSDVAFPPVPVDANPPSTV